MRQLRAYKFLDAVKNAYSFCSFISVHIPANYPRQGLSQPSFSCFSCTFSCIIRCYSEQNAMCRFSYQEKVNCDSYHPAIVPKKSLLIVCLNITGAPWLWTHCCNNSCLKDLTFTLLSERNQNSDNPDWNMRNSTRRQTKTPPHFTFISKFTFGGLLMFDE